MKIKIQRSQVLKCLVLLAVVCLVSSDVFAAGAGATGLETANTEVRKYLTPVSKIVLGVGGIVALIGAVRIYQKWNSGDQDINKELVSYGGSAAFLIIAPIVIKAMFGLTW